MVDFGAVRVGLMQGRSVREVPSKFAASLVIERHYLHRRPPISFAFGLMADSECVGVATFGVPPARHVQQSVCPTEPDRAIELNRLWIDDDEPRNSASWFVSRALRLLPPRIVFSYADTAAGHAGYVYRALSWHYAGWTDMDRKTPRFDYRAPEAFEDGTLFPVPSRALHPRDHSRNGRPSLVREPRKPKIRYWTTTGSDRQRRQHERICGWPSLDWHELPPPMSVVRGLTEC